MTIWRNRPGGKTLNPVRRGRHLIAALALIAASSALGAPPPATFERNGVQATLRTLGFEQAASFYLARGLPNALAERYARACVILVVMRSSRSDGVISTRLSDWRVRTADGAALQIRSRSDWLAELDRARVTPEARMAFEWGQFPEDADLHAGDSIRGMLSVPVSRASVFSLVMRWQSGDERHEGSIDAVRCD